ncbi:MAG: polysaccharide deacetylase family protein [Myxococcales bacterium]|nr:polysaccharide deacetylase family protein [Myxococcales bacterium]
MAVTLDDLPFVGDLAPGDTPEAAVGRILAALDGVPATGFFTCHGAGGREAAWQAWMASPIDLGNHTQSHRSIDDFADVAAWRRDVVACQERIEESAGDRPVRWFRYPFLRTGRERERRDAGFAVLDELGLTRAPVTVDVSDWALVHAYAPERDPEVAAAYVAHVRRAARRYRELATARGSADAPQILLIHANALAADHLGALLEGLREDGFRFVSLEEALAHPIFAEEDRYVGPVGMSWLYRIDGRSDAWAWDAAQLHAMQVRFRGAAERPRFDLDEDVAVERLDARTWRVTDGDAEGRLTVGPDDALAYDASVPTALADWAAARFGPDRL